nr:sulfite exporter TauE/SafE family protein [uncultured Oscillibacter sp.]
MTFTVGTALFIFLVQCLAYTVKGLIGFGNPLISAPLLSMRLDNVVITPGTLLLDCPVNAYITWKNRRSFQWRRILPLLLANLCGVIPGALLLRFSMPWVIKTVLGVVVVFLGAEMATRSLRPVRKGRDLPWLRLVVAFFSGVCAGLFGINMFIVAYLQRTAKDYSEFKGSMCFLFLGENLFRLCTYAVGGLLTREVLLFGLASVPAAALSMGLGGWLAPRLDEGRLQKGAIVLFILGGVSIIVKSVIFHT